MQRQIVWRRSPLALSLFVGGLFLVSCTDNGTPIQSTAAERLKPAVSVPGEPATGGTIYVPVYSSLFLGVVKQAQTVELAATLSVRNVSALHAITLDQVRYFDSNGKQVRDYIEKASTLPPMGSVEFVIQRSDNTGGPGANFLIHWHADLAVDAPLAEAVMVGQSGEAGISFISRGRALTSPER
mgnify:CR=1 FL=1